MRAFDERLAVGRGNRQARLVRCRFCRKTRRMIGMEWNLRKVKLANRSGRAVRGASWVMASLLSLAGVSLAADAGRWEVPLGGNAYLTASASGATDRVGPGGIGEWQSESSVFSIFFRVDRAALLDLSLRLKGSGAESVIRARVEGKSFEQKVAGGAVHEIELGSVAVKKAGYVRVDLQGIRKEGEAFAEVSDLLVGSEVAALTLDFVKEAGGNRFYWGRRGPSVHLSYGLPAGKKIEYFYSEVTVPKDMDPIGSYFMANGFGEGYFGMQVNGTDERRILFSVWSPFHTDDPNSIPEEERVQVLAKGPGVRVGEFGNEGSGGQSFLTFPWKAGATYRFLNRARPDGQGATIYTAWFSPPETGKWSLIASFRRPKTDKYLTGVHSFLENFQDRNGHQGRMAYYENQWVMDTEGKWHELTEAKFTGDDIAQRGYRLDYAGGAVKERFFMRNGGFFADTVKLGSPLKRASTRAKRPKIELDALEAAK